MNQVLVAVANIDDIPGGRDMVRSVFKEFLEPHAFACTYRDMRRPLWRPSAKNAVRAATKMAKQVVAKRNDCFPADTGLAMVKARNGFYPEKNCYTIACVFPSGKIIRQEGPYGELSEQVARDMVYAVVRNMLKRVGKI